MSAPRRQEAGRKSSVFSPTGHGCKDSFLTINPCVGVGCGSIKALQIPAFGRQFERPVWQVLGFHFRVSFDNTNTPTGQVWVCVPASLRQGARLDKPGLTRLQK